jgi:hypothetical protein
MQARFSILQVGKVLFNPNVAFVEIAKQPPSSAGVFFGFALWLGLCPPVFAYVGTMTSAGGSGSSLCFFRPPPCSRFPRRTLHCRCSAS